MFCIIWILMLIMLRNPTFIWRNNNTSIIHKWYKNYCSIYIRYKYLWCNVNIFDLLFYFIHSISVMIVMRLNDQCSFCFKIWHLYGKAITFVVDALSRKLLHMLILMVQKLELIEQLWDLSLLCERTLNNVKLSMLRLTRGILEEVKEC